MTEKKQFKAESKRLLEMMINSIYTHKEIFLRELISNASDAMDKLYFKSLNENIGLTRSDFKITLSKDKEARTITIADNGIGMSKEDLENNLGIIAESGSLKFKKDSDITEEDDINVIGQFGVGFYSAFMVAAKVVVKSKLYDTAEAFMWVSEGVDGYTVEPCEKEDYGTEITLYFKEDTEDEKYTDYINDYKIKNLIKKYSDYVRYPITMMCTHSRPVETSDEDKDEKDDKEPKYEDYTELETLNSMLPIWKKNKSELTDDDYNTFYTEKFNDYSAPIAHIHSKTEGSATYNALLYIPSKAPYDYYSKDYEKGLQLYSSGVLIMEKCGDLLPDYFSFVKGLVDSEDLSLNISREMLQHDRQLKLIAKGIEKSIKNELKALLEDDRTKYEAFWNEFGMQIKFGIYNSYGMNKELLSDLLLFYSSTEKKLVTLAEYVGRMKEDQKEIYFASGETTARIDNLPQVETLRDKGIEVLYLTQNVDEFTIQMLNEYQEKKFKSVQSADFEPLTDEEKEAEKSKNDEYKELCDFIKAELKEKVTDVRISSKLKSHSVCLSSGGSLSIEMEKVLNTMPGEKKAKADKVLEINAEHGILGKLQFLFDNDKDTLKTYSDILYTSALLVEGVSIEDPGKFAEEVSEILIK